MEIAWLEIADRPALWRELGFVVNDEGRCVIGSVEHRLVGSAAQSEARAAPDGPGSERTRPRKGILRWAVSGIDPGTTTIDGLPTTVVEGHEPKPTSEHPNGVFKIDHLVIGTSSTPRTAGALTAAGLVRRGGRTTNSGGEAVDMTFFWAGDTLLELAGPPTPAQTATPARFRGIAYATTDLDATVARLGSRSTTPVNAVQSGRRIAALTTEAGSTLAMAFMTPHLRTH
jgi:Glyoxalase-like domain